MVPSAAVGHREAALWVAAAAVRLVLLWLPGHPADLAAFYAWAVRLAEVGPWRFYSPGLFADYLPGYLLLLWPLGFLLRGQPGLAPVLLKVPPAVADFAVARLLVRLADKHRTPAAAAYLLNPAVLVAGAWWGQAESAAVAWLLGSVLALARGRPGWAGVLFGAACLTKPQYAVAGGVLLLGSVRGRQGVGLLARAAAGCAVTVLAGGLLFGLSPLGLARLAVWASSTYPYGSVNALNLWYVAGLNWRPDALPVFGVPAAAWGLALSAGAVAWTAWRVAGRGEVGVGALGAAAVSAATFACATRMHERYLFPALPFALLAWARGRSPQTWWVALSAAALVNLAFGFAYLASSPRYATPPWSALWPALSGIASHLAAVGAVVLAAWGVGQVHRVGCGRP